MGAGTAMVERLQAQVKQKDGEILLLQVSLCATVYCLLLGDPKLPLSTRHFLPFTKLHKLC